MKHEAFTYLESIARDIKLAEGVNGIKRVLVALHRAGKASIHDLAVDTRIAPPIISLLTTKLAESGLVHRDSSGIRFTERGMKYVESEMQIVSLAVNPCQCCAGTSIETDAGGIHQRLFERLEFIVKARPSADVALDQVKCTTETILRRLLLFHEEGAFDGTRILFLGDDDFISVSACAKEFLSDYFIQPEGEVSAPFSVTAIDVDPRIVGANQAIAKDMNVKNLSSHVHDAREPLPNALKDSFDVVFIDPPYTLAGCKLFLSRAIDALVKQNGSKIFLSFGHVSSTVLQAVQRLVVQSGLFIERAIPSFNEYEGGNIIANMSQMLVLAASGKLVPCIPSNEYFSESMYTNDEGKNE